MSFEVGLRSRKLLRRVCDIKQQNVIKNLISNETHNLYSLNVWMNLK